MIYNQLNLAPSDRTDGTFHKGFVESSWQVEVNLSKLENYRDWASEASFSDGGLRAVWINIREWQTLTYCEGDILLQTFDNALDFYHSLNEAALFYKDN